MSDLSGRTILVTGATSGIGLALAELLNSDGAAVIGLGRSPQRCAEAQQRLRAANPQAGALYIPADLSLQSEVRRAAGQVREALAQTGKGWLDGLVNNAGTFTYWMALTAEGIETQWAVNYLAAFLLTHELLPLLRAAPAARVVTVSSDSHYGARLRWEDIQLRRSYNGLRAYGQTKLAGVLFSLELKRRLAGFPAIGVCAADPGLVKTEIGFKGTPGLVRWFWSLRRSGGVSAEQSARGILRLLSEPGIQESGAIYWKDGRPKQASRAALDGDSARRLWVLSETMCGLRTVEELR